MRSTHSFSVVPSAACTAAGGTAPTRPPAATAGPSSRDLSEGEEEGADSTGVPAGLLAAWQAGFDAVQVDPCGACCLLVVVVGGQGDR